MGPVAERASADLGLLERAEFIDALEESFAAVTGGRGRLVLVSGEAGIGKSALVRGFCGGRGRRTRVLWGACDALGTPRPLSPLIDMAAAVEGAFPASMREGEKPHAVFVALLEELRARPPTIAVIEDVHWADEATLDIVRLLARRAEALGALVVVTYREDELEPGHPLRLAVGELGTAPGIAQLRLPPLSRSAVEELAVPHGVDAGELHVKTAGNPFFVTEVLAGGGTEVPPTVRDAVLGRASRLGAAARGVLEAVAVVPPHVEMWLLDEVVPDEVVHVDACLAAGMLQGEGRTVSFRHELARLAVEQSIGPHRRALLHRRVLEALRNPPEGALPDPAQLAYHAEAAGNARAVLHYATAAGTRAASQGAHREAAAQFARALRFAGSLSPAELGELFERQAHELYLTNCMDDAVAAQQRALECYRELGDRRSESRALCSLSEMLWCPGRIAESEQASRDAVTALDGLEPGRELARAYLQIASLADTVEATIEWATRAQRIAERIGDDDTALRARVEIGITHYADDGSRESAARLEETLELAAAAELEVQVGQSWSGLAWGASRHRAYADLDRYIEAGLAYCGEHDLEIYARYLHVYRARAALDRARWDEAADAAMVVVHDRGPSIIPLLSGLVVAGLVRARQGVAGSSELLERAAGLAEQQGRLFMIAPVAAARAEVAWLEGRRDAIPGLTDAAADRAAREDARHEVAAVLRWRWRVGLRDPAGAGTGPDAATLAGDWAAGGASLDRGRLPLRGGAGARRRRRRRRAQAGSDRAAAHRRAPGREHPRAALARARGAWRAARPVRGCEGEPGESDGARTGGAGAPGRGPPQRRDRRPSGRVAQDRRAPCFGAAAQARRTHARRGRCDRPEDRPQSSGLRPESAGTGATQARRGFAASGRSRARRRPADDRPARGGSRRAPRRGG